MDTFTAYCIAQRARERGDSLMVFDWNKAATIIRDRGVSEASAGLCSDWEYTGGVIFEDGKPVKSDYTYLASLWAVPELLINGEYIPCYIMEEDTEWDANTNWPESALRIFGE